MARIRKDGALVFVIKYDVFSLSVHFPPVNLPIQKYYG